MPPFRVAKPNDFWSKHRWRYSKQTSSLHSQWINHPYQFIKCSLISSCILESWADRGCQNSYKMSEIEHIYTLCKMFQTGSKISDYIYIKTHHKNHIFADVSVWIIRFHGFFSCVTYSVTVCYIKFPLVAFFATPYPLPTGRVFVFRCTSF